MKKGPTHGARHGKTEEQKEYHMAWNAWKRCCKKVDSQGEHFTGIHDRFLRDPVYRESQLASGWTEHKCKKWETCTRRPYISSHSRGRDKIRRTMVSYLEQSRQKMGLWNFDPIFEPLSWWKIVYTTNQENKLKSLSIQINTDDGIPLQAHRGGTSLNGIGNELIIFFFLMRLLFVKVGFV